MQSEIPLEQLMKTLLLDSLQTGCISWILEVNLKSNCLLTAKLYYFIARIVIALSRITSLCVTDANTSLYTSLHSQSRSSTSCHGKVIAGRSSNSPKNRSGSIGSKNVKLISVVVSRSVDHHLQSTCFSPSLSVFWVTSSLSLFLANTPKSTIFHACFLQHGDVDAGKNDGFSNFLLNNLSWWREIFSGSRWYQNFSHWSWSFGFHAPPKRRTIKGTRIADFATSVCLPK